MDVVKLASTGATYSCSPFLFPWKGARVIAIAKHEKMPKALSMPNCLRAGINEDIFDKNAIEDVSADRKSAVPTVLRAIFVEPSSLILILRWIE